MQFFVIDDPTICIRYGRQWVSGLYGLLQHVERHFLKDFV